MIFALDPGNKQTGWVLFDEQRVIDSGVGDNNDVLRWVRAGQDADELAIEMMAARGMPTSNEEMQTLVWIGRFQQVWLDMGRAPVRFVHRSAVKMHLCGNMKARDPNIRQALIDKIGPVGTKKNPGPCHGVASHAWAALGVAVCAAET